MRADITLGSAGVEREALTHQRGWPIPQLIERQAARSGWVTGKSPEESISVCLMNGDEIMVPTHNLSLIHI